MGRTDTSHSPIKAIARVMRSPFASRYKLVMVALLTRAHWDEEEGLHVCWPSYTTIAADTSLSRATVATTLAELRHAGAFKTRMDPEEGASVRYLLHLPTIEGFRERGKGDPARSFLAKAPRRKA